MKNIACAFRRDVHRHGDAESANCELLRRLLDDRQGDRSRIDRSACEYCFNEGKQEVHRISEVLGSALLQACCSESFDPLRPAPTAGNSLPTELPPKVRARMMELACLAIADPDRNHRGPIREQRNRNLVSRNHRQSPNQEASLSVDKPVAPHVFVPTSPAPTQKPISAVDVVVAIRQIDASTISTVDAWLRQRDVFSIVHLVLDSGLFDTIPRRWLEDPSIRRHPFQRWDFGLAKPSCLQELDPVTAVFVATHQIVGKMESRFIALGCPGFLPVPHHLSAATDHLVRRGHEWFAGSIQDHDQVHPSERPSSRHGGRRVQPASVVMRRSMWVDLNGMARRLGDADVEFFDRAGRQDREATVVRDVVATRILDAPPGTPKEGSVKLHSANFQPAPLSDPFQLHQHGIGFSVRGLRCDVVLPFRGQLQFVEQAIDSILSQKHIDWTLHLVDDDTQENIDNWLKGFQSNPRIHVYRNQRNLGQFISVNNIVPHLRSNWIVTQDGDDMSLPDRLVDAVRIGELCRADLVAGVSVLDGPEEKLQQQAHQGIGRGENRRWHRFSFVPRPDFAAYFLENPTLIHRKEFFVRMGGFADFAHPLRNRTSIDSEYMLRALHANANIVATRRLAIRYRIHDQSAIQREETRMGSPVRQWAQRELARRVHLVRRGGVDPAVFGALGRHTSLTRKWEG